MIDWKDWVKDADYPLKSSSEVWYKYRESDYSNAYTPQWLHKDFVKQVLYDTLLDGELIQELYERLCIDHNTDKEGGKNE